MDFASMDVVIKSPPGNCPYSFREHGHIYYLVSLPYANETDKPGYGQFLCVMFSILLQQQQNALQTNKPKSIWSK
jgi:hypothetical protein